MTVTRMLCVILGAMLLGGAFIVPRAYGLEKLPIMLLLLTLLVANRYQTMGAGALRMGRPIKFFLAFAAINVLPLFVGALHGNPDQAIIDGIRLGVVFPLIIAILWASLSDFDYGRYINGIIEFSAVCILVIISLAILEALGAGDFYSMNFVQANELRVGVHEGYVQVTSHNVGSLFFISGYLLYYAVGNKSDARSARTIVALLCALLAAMLSGRRALQFAICLAPFFLLFTAKVFAESSLMIGRIAKLYSIIGIGLAMLVFYIFSSGYWDASDFVERFAGVFEDDGGARTSQAATLYSAFLTSPYFGSGVGGTTEVVRSDSAPWNYELTYVQLLYNFGLVGALAILYLIFREIWRIGYNARGGQLNYPIEVKAMFCGVLFLMFGAATNPYFGSFEFLLMLGIIPFAADAANGVRRGPVTEANCLKFDR